MKEIGKQVIIVGHVDHERTAMSHAIDVLLSKGIDINVITVDELVKNKTILPIKPLPELIFHELTENNYDPDGHLRNRAKRRKEERKLKKK
jgi:hypothetical protein